MKKLIFIAITFIFITNCNSQSSQNTTEIEADKSAIINFDNTQIAQWRG